MGTMTFLWVGTKGSKAEAGNITFGFSSKYLIAVEMLGFVAQKQHFPNSWGVASYEASERLGCSHFFLFWPFNSSTCTLWHVFFQCFLFYMHFPFENSCIVYYFHQGFLIASKKSYNKQYVNVWTVQINYNNLNNNTLRTIELEETQWSISYQGGIMENQTPTSPPRSWAPLACSKALMLCFASVASRASPRLQDQSCHMS